MQAIVRLVLNLMQVSLTLHKYRSRMLHQRLSLVLADKEAKACKAKVVAPILHPQRNLTANLSSQVRSQTCIKTLRSRTPQTVASHMSLPSSDLKSSRTSTVLPMVAISQLQPAIQSLEDSALITQPVNLICSSTKSLSKAGDKMLTWLCDLISSRSPRQQRPLHLPTTSALCPRGTPLSPSRRLYLTLYPHLTSTS